MLTTGKVRILAGIAFALLVVVDLVYHVEIGKFMTDNPLGGIISCVLAASALAALLNALLSGKLSFDGADQKWLAALLFVALLFRYSLVSFFQLTPTVLVFGAIFVCIIGVYRLRWLDGAGDVKRRDLGLTMRVLSLGLLFGLYLVVAAVGYASKENPYTVERTAMGWALAYFAVLFLVGFLFGYPRTLQGEGEKKTPYEQRVNTNLEQISDWLTKIIVGLGLVELRTVPEKLLGASKWMAQSFASTGLPSDALVSFCGAFIIFFSVLGFLAGHLCTRMFLAPAFYRGDQRELVPVERQTAVPDDIAKKYLTFIATKENADKVDAWLTMKGKPTLKASDIVAGSEFADLREGSLKELDKT